MSGKGTLYKRPGSNFYMMGVTIEGRQRCKTTGTTNKKLAQQMLARWVTEVFEGRYQLVRSNPPTFPEWANEFLATIQNPRTRARYAASINNLKNKFADTRLPQITADLIEDYKDERQITAKVGPATINRDLAVLRRMLRIAERRRFIARSPFVEVEFLDERCIRRKPHIVSYPEEERILMAADPHIRALVVLLLETGLRPNCEALLLRWEDIDLINETVRVGNSKTQAGLRNIPLSARCASELEHWRNLVGPKVSPYVFPNMRNTSMPLRDVRRSWAKALRLAKIEYFWIYNLRHTFASRLSAAGVADLFVAQMIGHSSPSIVHTYARAVDEHKRDAIRKLESLRSTFAVTAVALRDIN